MDIEERKSQKKDNIQDEKTCITTLTLGITS